MENKTPTIEREPLKPWDGKPLLPWKTNTALRRHLFNLSELVPIMLQVEAALGDNEVGVYFGTHSWHGGTYLDLSPADDAQARRIVGSLIRAFKSKPQIKKTGDDTMESFWRFEASDFPIMVTVKGYKPKTCRYEEVIVEVPAEEARTETIHHAAVPASTKTKRILVCDEVEPEAEAATEEVPF